MSANTIITSVVTGGTNNHTTVAEEVNALSTDFVTQGVVGAITLNTGSGGTGSFCVNADASPDMGITIKAGQAYITATPSSQDSQVLRARASSDYTTYTINYNISGSTKYDWIYLSVSATNANVPDSAGDNVTSISTSRSSSNSTDNGTPPTYGLLLAVVTVANAASSITNGNITDKRFNASIGAQNGSLIVTQSATGQNAKIQAAGVDANVALELDGKGTSGVTITSGPLTVPSSSLTTFGGALTSYTPTLTSFTTGNGTVTSYYQQVGKLVSFYGTITLGSTSAVSGAVTISLPVNANARIGAFFPPGVATYEDNSAGTVYNGLIYKTNAAQTLTLDAWKVTGAPAFVTYQGGIGSSAPFTWATSDLIMWAVYYEAA